jgi:hypothetical protein
MENRYLLFIISMIFFGTSYISNSRRIEVHSMAIHHVDTSILSKDLYSTSKSSAFSTIDSHVDTHRRCVGRGSFGHFRTRSLHHSCSQSHNCSTDNSFVSFQTRLDIFLKCFVIQCSYFIFSDRQIIYQCIREFCCCR